MKFQALHIRVGFLVEELVEIHFFVTRSRGVEYSVQYALGLRKVIYSDEALFAFRF